MDTLLERINELARKSKAEGLTEEEVIERDELRQQYLDAFRGRLRNVLDNVEITSEFTIHIDEINDLSNITKLQENENIVSITPEGQHYIIVYLDEKISELEIRRFLAQ